MSLGLPEDEARALATEDPKAFEEIWRNCKQLAGLRIGLSLVFAHQIRELVEKS